MNTWACHNLFFFFFSAFIHNTRERKIPKYPVAQWQYCKDERHLASLCSQTIDMYTQTHVCLVRLCMWDLLSSKLFIFFSLFLLHTPKQIHFVRLPVCPTEQWQLKNKFTPARTSEVRSVYRPSNVSIRPVDVRFTLLLYTFLQHNFRTSTNSSQLFSTRGKERERGVSCGWSKYLVSHYFVQEGQIERATLCYLYFSHIAYPSILFPLPQPNSLMKWLATKNG